MLGGPDVTVTIPAGTIISLVSQADADAQALAIAKAEAEALLSCEWFGNDEQTLECFGSTKIAAAGTFFSEVSQAAADEQALASLVAECESDAYLLAEDDFEGYPLGGFVSGDGGINFNGEWRGGIRLFSQYQLFISANNGGNFVGTLEWQAFDDPGGSNFLLNESIVASSETSTGNGPAERAVDGLGFIVGTNFGWVSLQDSVIDQWLIVTLSAPSALTTFTVASYGTAVNTNARSPKDFEVLGSNDGVNWVHVWNVTNVNTWVFEEVKTFAGF